MSCDLNPAPVASGNGFDYNAIKASVAQNLVSDRRTSTTTSVVPERRGGGTDADDDRTEQILQNTRRLSRLCKEPSPLSRFPNDVMPSISNPRVSGRSRFEG